ncbi:MULTISPECIES: DUF6461 domain-containing protein [unclassified Streptomyces]|uniref:DUF6461 domain-containing protein n=1 Tax=unclassified Streptomyces TaxID=2593676 RepID=UPI0036691462
MATTAADYMWFEEDFPGLAESYCVTLVHNLPPNELLGRLGGRSEPEVTGITALVDTAYDLWGPSTTRTYFGMTTLGPWTLMVEPNGRHGVNEEKALPASAGIRWISHYDNANANNGGSFLWVEDTEVQLRFELHEAEYLTGTRAGDALAVIRRLGFTFPEEPTETDDDLAVPAAFALAEHRTGIRVTPALLQGTTYICGTAEFR